MMRWKLLSPLLLSSMILSMGVARAEAPGDPTGDGQVNVTDAVLTLKFAVQLETPTPGQSKAADVAPVTADGVYGDGQVNVADATRILKRSVGLETSDTFPGTRYYADNPPSTGAVALPVFSSVSLQADTTQNITLPGGFLIQGKLTNPSGTSSSLDFVDGSQTIVVGSIPSQTGDYKVGVPAGSYQVFYDTTVQTTPSGPIPIPVTTRISVLTGITIPVNADVTQDIPAPPLPPLFKVSGSVTPPAGVTPPFSLTITQEKDANGNPLGIQGGSGTTLFSFDGTYTAELPAGTYTANIALIGSGSGSASVKANESIVVTGDTTQNLTVPALFTLSGQVAMAGGGPLPDSVSVQLFPGDPSTFNGGGTYSSSTVDNGAYSLQQTTGDYSLSVNLSSGASGSEGTWNYAAGKVTLSGDMTKDLTVPTLPTARVTVQGNVVGPDGSAVTKGSIYLTGKTLAGADPGLSFSQSVDLSATGGYSASVPPGAYTMLVEPEPGFPVGNRF